MQSQERSRPGGELPGERDVDGAGHMAGRKCVRGPGIEDDGALLELSLHLRRYQSNERRESIESGCTPTVDFRVLLEILRLDGDDGGQLVDEFLAAANLERVVGQALDADGGTRLGAHVAPAKRPRPVRRVHQHAVRKTQNL